MSLIDKGVGGLQKITEISSNTSELAASHRQFVTKQVINIILLFVILVVFGCFDFLHFKFHFEYLQDANYWGNVITKAIADICAYNVGINFVIDDIIKRNRVLAEVRVLYIKLNGNKSGDFQHYIERVYNPECKKAAWIAKVNYKIHLLNKYSRRSSQILYTSDLPEKQELKLKNHYCIKRKELEYLKTDEYIESNFETLNVRYINVDHTIFELEIDGTQKVKKNKVTGSVNAGRAKASATTILSVVGISMFASSFSLAPNQEEFVEGAVAAGNYIMKAMTDIGIIVWQFFRGLLGATGIVSQQITAPLVERVEILKKYYAWRQANGQSVPQCYLDLFKETIFRVKDDNSQNEQEVKRNEPEVTEIEMTPEEYEEYKKNHPEE